MSHAFAPAFGGASAEKPGGVCAFCGEEKLEGDHRELTDEERAETEQVIDRLVDFVTGAV